MNSDHHTSDAKSRAHRLRNGTLSAALLELASCVGYVVTVRLVLPDAPARQVRWLGWAEMALGALVPLHSSGVGVPALTCAG